VREIVSFYFLFFFIFLLALEALPSSEMGAGSTSSFAYKGANTKTVHFGSKVAILTSYKKLSVLYFQLKCKIFFSF